MFGIFRTGKWIEADQVTRFNFIKATKKYTSNSHANVRFDMNVSDIELLIINSNGTKKVVLNKYSNFKDAQKKMGELNMLLLPNGITD